MNAHGDRAASSSMVAPAMAAPNSWKLESPTPSRVALAAAPMATASPTTGWTNTTATRTSVVRRATVLAAGQIRTAYSTGISVAIR
jgi:hypothetical protein